MQPQKNENFFHQSPEDNKSSERPLVVVPASTSFQERQVSDTRNTCPDIPFAPITLR